MLFPLKMFLAGDKIIITGRVAEHGLSILSKRKGMDLGLDIKSDCASLDSLLVPLLYESKAIKFMRDPTRGGLATTLNEIAQSTQLGVIIQGQSIPIDNKVRAIGELLGIDPLYIANEGKAVIVADSKSADTIVKLLKQQRLGRYAGIIGKVVANPKGMVILKTTVGTERILDMLSSEPLPRIC